MTMRLSFLIAVSIFLAARTTALTQNTRQVAVRSSETSPDQPVFKSELVDGNTPGYAVDVVADIAGAKKLYLVALPGSDGDSYDWCDWIDPRLVGPGGERSLLDLKWKSASAGWGSVHQNRNCAGQTLSVNGKSFSSGIGTHAASLIEFDLPADHDYTRFVARAALDDGGVQQRHPPASSVQFMVYTTRPNWPVSGSQAHDPVTSLAQFDVNPQLSVSLFASEPMIVNPTNIDIDAQGRVWVCEAVNYRNQMRDIDMPQHELGDRITVLEDRDHDGAAETLTTFYQGHDIDSPHGICVLDNRVIVSVGDSVFSFVDEDGDLHADRKDVLFTGISGTQHDHGIHAFVFGPDGKLYFNFGNAGNQIRTPQGDPIVDLSGNRVEMKRPYQNGMVFRCNLDGSGLETLAWNFRNNWETCIDSFGRLWQSDNDDDGNRSTRINWILPYGNYGYCDEMNGSGWQVPRSNLESEIPARHWHLNDPGVVPNLLGTGAGSPTGILFYEGELLPEAFRQQVIHCDAGPNIVRAYRLTSDEAGYTAKIDEMLSGARANQWFRPSDVCVAPDGSLIVADWFDPGVGGHRMQDPSGGRLYRLVPAESSTQYRNPSYDWAATDSVLQALGSPNQATRFLAWKALKKLGAETVEPLVTLSKDKVHPWLAARALWALAVIHSGNPRANSALLAAADAENPEIRACLARIIRDQMGSPLAQRYWAQVRMSDSSPHVRAEWAIAQSHRVPNSGDSETRARRWASVAATYQPGDRWMLEALGIGAEENWESCLRELRKDPQWSLASPATRDLIWRSRSPETANWLVDLIRAADVDADQSLRYFRAMDFQEPRAVNTACRRLAFDSNIAEPRKSNRVMIECLARISGKLDPSQGQKVVDFVRSLDPARDFVQIVDRFDLTDFANDLVAIAVSDPDSQLTVDSVRVLFRMNQQSRLLADLIDWNKTDDQKFSSLLRALSTNDSSAAANLLDGFIHADSATLEHRRQAVTTLGRTRSGSEILIQWAEGKSYDSRLEPALIAALYLSPVNEIKDRAGKLFPMELGDSGRPIPDLQTVLRLQADIGRGQGVFTSQDAACAKCHLVRGAGQSVGPDLSEIGSKLTREALLESILYPSAGIAHNFENWNLLTLDGSTVNGLLISRTDSEVQLKDAEGKLHIVPASEIDELKMNRLSLMPDGLQDKLNDQQLADLIAFLQSLKTGSESPVTGN